MHILYDAPLPGESIEEIRRLIPGVKLSPTPVQQTPRELLSDADVLYTQAANFNPADAPRLRWIQTDSAATQGVWGKPVLKTSIPVCNASGAYSAAVAECTFGMLLALTRRIVRGVHFQRECRWPGDLDYEPWAGIDLYGTTLGIVGYGSIGRQVARLAQAMNMQVLACKRRPELRRDDTYLLPNSGDPDGLIPAEWYGIDRVREMFARCDFVVVTLPEVPTTVKLLGAAELTAIPKHAWLVNVGRGKVIDEPELIRLLQEGRFAGAALDVVAQEPMPPENPLWKLPNVLIMPHIASWTVMQARRSSGVLIENLRRDLAGQPLVNQIDKELLY